MNVLLVEYDLYKSVGGGQTVYKRLIAGNPGINFFYLGRKEAPEAIRPPNATRVPFKESYPASDLTGEFTDIAMPLWAYPDFVEASNIAASVAHLRIDVIDTPDYRVAGYLLAPALARHGQKACKIALALHGNVSETQRVNWGCLGEADLSMDQREQWQYRVADVRYGLSRDYLDHWHALGGKAGHYLSPLRFLAPPKVLPWHRSRDGVSLNFIGRTEGFKGPDLFVELLAWLPEDCYRLARIIGPSVLDRNKVSSRDHLQKMAALRGLRLELHDCMGAAEMAAIHADRGITVLPSRMDTFNLTALESLYAGCPVAVSEKAGVCRFLRESYPGVPFVALDVDRLYAATPALRQLIDDYDRQRDRLAQAIATAVPVLEGATLGQIYESGGDSEEFLRRQASALYDRILSFHERHRTPPLQTLTSAGVRAWDALRHSTSGAKQLDPRKEADLWALYREMFYLPENSAAEIDEKIAGYTKISRGSRLDRARVWSELARLERTRGNTFVAATYDIRVLRALGGDRTGILPAVVADLRSHGFPQEAEAVIALYGPKDERLERGRALLDAAYSRHRTAVAEPFEFIAEGRGDRPPRVSIIVSLYGAADKLEAFVRMLTQQPWVRDGRAELVFIDSHSPTDEHAVFQRVSASLGLSAVYARTQARETIQKAWNRGILLARAPYLTFLGVDETMRPQALATLAGELDADSSLDWVQGSSVITEVNGHGTPQRDGMLYQRTPYAQDLVYLETCYLSWVGALYRKDIHERFGYYDETFGAAGDTEFKNRILPLIKTKTLPMTLGVFLNYPEERTTQSPRAEVEDLRAWYLHRSEAGVGYAMGRRETDEVWHLLKRTLGYRKSYCNHLSSDLDFAHEVASYLSKRSPGPLVSSCAESVGRVLQAHRDLDWLPALSPGAAQRQRKRAGEIATEEARRIQSLLRGCEQVVWRLFNDNRYEQHGNVWPSAPLAGKSGPGDRAFWFRPIPPSGDATEAARPAAGPIGGEEPAGAAGRLGTALRHIGHDAARQGKIDLARDVGNVANYLQALSEGKRPAVPKAGDAGSVLCTVLAESQWGRPWSQFDRFDRNFANLCGLLADAAAPLFPELGDILEELAAYTTRELEKVQSMEVAARVLACKSPVEAVQRHKAELSVKVVETLQTAASSARSKGNTAYSDRLNTYAAAIKCELAKSA
jgi:glycosyltransferase involved in cell wall biosynthesis